MPWDKGFNFRATSGYVTDGTNETYVLATDAYPTTRNGSTFGWSNTANMDHRDRSTSVDRRLAGINFCATATSFRVDLPSAVTFAISMAMGDNGSQQNFQTVILKDNTTTLTTIPPSGTAITLIDHFLDPNNTDHTSAAWPGSNTTYSAAFSSTIFNATLGGGGGNAALAHLFLSQSTVTGNYGFPYRRTLRPAPFRPGLAR